MRTNLMQKKRKLGVLIHGLCSEFEGSLAKFVQGVGKLEQADSSRNKRTTGANEQGKTKKQRTRTRGKNIIHADEESQEEDDSEDTEPEDADSEDDTGYV